MQADCHMHMVLDGVDWKQSLAAHESAPQTALVHKVLKTYQALGVTYLRDGGDRFGAGALAREIAPQYGITYRTPLAPLCLRGHYGSFIGICYDTLSDYARLVVQTREQGGDFIKIMVSGLMDFDRFGVLTQEPLPPALIKELIHIAHEEGMSVMAHANGARTVEAAANAGVDSVGTALIWMQTPFPLWKAAARFGCPPFPPSAISGEGVASVRMRYAESWTVPSRMWNAIGV